MDPNDRQGGKKFGTLRIQQDTYLDRINRQILKDEDFEFIFVPALSQRLDIYKRKFMDFDYNNSDDIDFNEFKRMLESLGETKTHIQCKRLFSQCAKTTRDKIHYRDFVDMLLGDTLGLGIIFEEEQDVVDKAEMQRQRKSVFKPTKRMAPPPPVPVIEEYEEDDDEEEEDEGHLYESFDSPPSYRSREDSEELDDEDDEDDDDDDETDEEDDDEDTETETEEPKPQERTFTDITRNMERNLVLRSEAPQGNTPLNHQPPSYMRVVNDRAGAPEAEPVASTSSDPGRQYVVEETNQRAAPHDVPNSARYGQTTNIIPPPSVCATRELPPEATLQLHTKLGEPPAAAPVRGSHPYSYICTDPNCPDSHAKPAPVAPQHTASGQLCTDPTCPYNHSQPAATQQPQQFIQQQIQQVQQPQQQFVQAQQQPQQFVQAQQQPQQFMVQNSFQDPTNQGSFSYGYPGQQPAALQQPQQQQMMFSTIPMQQQQQPQQQPGMPRNGSFTFMQDAVTQDDFVVPQNMMVNNQIQNGFGNQVQFVEIPSGYVLQ